jgi:hypothetical protein
MAEGQHAATSRQVSPPRRTLTPATVFRPNKPKDILDPIRWVTGLDLALQNVKKSSTLHAVKTNEDVVRLDGDPKEKAKSFTEVSDILGYIMADVQSLKDRIADWEGDAQFDGLDLKTIVGGEGGRGVGGFGRWVL